jgi:hypothetical protein
MNFIFTTSKEANMQTSSREKRVAVRSRVFFGGEIRIDAELPAIECHVKNVSAGGASIVVPSGEFLPQQFDIFIRKTNQQRYAVVTWSRGRQFGIAYRPRPGGENVFCSPSRLRQILRPATR